MKYNPCKVIAEIGCNHKGDMGIAFELLDLAKQAGADVAKFQIAFRLNNGLYDEIKTKTKKSTNSSW